MRKRASMTVNWQHTTSVKFHLLLDVKMIGLILFAVCLGSTKINFFEKVQVKNPCAETAFFSQGLGLTK
jgi:hypothetical protein